MLMSYPGIAAKSRKGHQEPRIRVRGCCAFHYCGWNSFHWDLIGWEFRIEHWSDLWVQ